MKCVLILNDPPYGSERSYNGLRLAHALKKNAPDAEITVFLMADAVLCANAGQKTPEGFYNIEKMVRRVVSSGGRVLMCGTCMDARGMSDAALTEGAVRSTMDALATACIEADKVMVF
ncbi:MAG: DsrE family protein [Siculibacillus sp.]|nr:DsrE family protein [Siculibacillus sp.]